MDWADRIGRRIKLRDLHVLMAIADAGSMAKASARVAGSHPFISKTISDLEQAFDDADLLTTLIAKRPRKPTLVGLKKNQRINPMQSKFAPAEGVTPPAEVHACPTVHSAPCTTRYRCLPTGVTGSRSRPPPPGFGQIVLCRPDAWVRVSFAHTRVSIVGWIYDLDHSLPPGMYADVLDCLLVAVPTALEGLDH